MHQASNHQRRQGGECFKKLRFLSAHTPGLPPAPLMVIADQMQDSVNQQAQDLFIQGMAERFCLAPGRGNRNHDVPEQGRHAGPGFPIRKRQDVRGSILVPIRPVQPSHPRLADQPDTDFGFGLVKEPQEFPGDATQRPLTNRHTFHATLNADGHESLRGPGNSPFTRLDGGNCPVTFIHRLPPKPHLCPFRFHVGCRP